MNENGAAIEHWRSKLSDKLPTDTEKEIAKWIVGLNVRFIVSPPRKTKLGDFRVGRAGKAHRISVNGNLNPYSFLVTTVHEFAHLGCYLRHGNAVAPHGKEWKSLYVKLMRPFVDRGDFPEDLTYALRKHLNKPKASSCTCPILSRALAEYDDQEGEPLGSFRPGDVFIFMDKNYKYLRLRRTRVLCERLTDGKHYLISNRARVSRFPTSLS